MNITGFIGRNNLRGWAILNPATALAEKRLMDAYAKEHPGCEACGESRKGYTEVHHRIALWHSPEQAGTPPSGRFMVLCNHRASNHHLVFGHAGNFAKHYVGNVGMICAAHRAVLDERRVVSREETVEGRVKPIA